MPMQTVTHLRPPVRRGATATAAVLAAGALLAGGEASTAAAQTPYCTAGSLGSWAKVQLFRDARCGGPSVAVGAGEAGGDRPDFARFANFDGRTYGVEDSRSSLAVRPGTCVRVFTGKGYTGTGSATLCAGATPGYFVLSTFDDQVSSMRVCSSGAPQACGAPAAPPPPQQPAPDPGPGPGAGSFRPDVRSAPDRARYDDGAPWSGGANCTGGFTRGADRVGQWLRAQYPGTAAGSAGIQGYNCRANTANRSRTSIHGVGRAVDWFRNANRQSQRRDGDRFVARIGARRASQARAMGIQYVIWNRRQYSVTNTGLRERAYTGPNPHTDHLHVEVNLAGADLRTSYWR